MGACWIDRAVAFFGLILTPSCVFVSSRAQLDMLIENNAAAIRVLEPIAAQAKELPPEQARR